MDVASPRGIALGLGGAKTAQLVALGAAHLFPSPFCGYDLWLRNYARFKIREKIDIFVFRLFSNSTLHSGRAGHSAQYPIFVFAVS